ncbi:MAG: hypothetical protein ACXACC_05075 [Promethearchaeota archaeon]|jgi:hypothetical protein
MPLSKKKIKSNLQNYLNYLPTTIMLPTEKRYTRLRGNQLIELFYAIRTGGLFTGINRTTFQREFGRVSQVQSAIGGLFNKFNKSIPPPGLPQQAYDIFITNPYMRTSYKVTAEEITTTLFNSYNASCELIVRLLKQVINFPDLYRMIANVPRYIKRPSGNKITLSALSLFDLRYNTNAFLEIDRELRNKISHFDFSFFKSNIYFGIKFKYFDYITRAIREKRYNLPKIIKKNRQISLLFHAVSITISPSFF